MNNQEKTYRTHAGRNLTDRESNILGLVIHSFIEIAGPVGSQYLAKNYPVGLSSASIRNTMNTLEELGYLGHPHTSAGRVPTDLGYRKFVDQLMQPSLLTKEDKEFISSQLENISKEPAVLIRECSRLLGQLSNLLGVVLSPRLSAGILERLEIVPLSSSRIMFVLSLKGRLVKTMILEVSSNLKRDDLDQVVRILNERLAGLTLEEIRKTLNMRVLDLNSEPTGIVKLVLSAPKKFFGEPAEERLSVAGAQNILIQPEFMSEPEELRKLIEMLENANFIVQLMETDHTIPGRASVSIGSENKDGKVEKYSIVKAQYQLGQSLGTIGIIGPKRMDYARVFALVEGMAALLSQSDVIKS